MKNEPLKDELGIIGERIIIHEIFNQYATDNEKREYAETIKQCIIRMQEASK